MEASPPIAEEVADQHPSSIADPCAADALASFRLRTRLSSGVKFYDLWRFMEGSGWTHDSKNSRYFSPDGTDWGTAKDAFAKLDELGGMPPRRLGVAGATGTPSRSTFYSIDKVKDEDNEDGKADRERARRLRDELLGGYWRHYRAGGTDKSRKRMGVIGSSSVSEGKATPEDAVEAAKGSSDPVGAPTSGLFELDEDLTKDGQEIGAAKLQSKAETRHRSSMDPGVRMVFERSTSRKPRAKRKASAATSRAKRFSRGNATKNGQEEQPAYYLWPDIETNVTTVRNHALEISPDPVGVGIEALDDQYEVEFAQWSFLLATDHSLLLYGFGSKRSLLNDFACYHLAQWGDVLTLNGYDRDIGIDAILDLVVGRYLNGIEPRLRSSLAAPTSPEDGMHKRRRQLGHVQPSQGSPAVVRRAFAIAEKLASARQCPLFLVVHNIDGVGLRSHLGQSALSTLVAASTGVDGCRMVRLAASIDHVNAPLALWTTTARVGFGWVYRPVNTYRPYFEEVRLGATATNMGRKTKYGSTVGGRSDKTGSSGGDNMGFLRVLTSLGPRNAECLQNLARLQLLLVNNAPSLASEHASGNVGFSVTYKAWKEECLRKMSVSDDSSLRRILVELLDHGIIVKSHDMNNGTLRVHIPHKDKVLDQILDFDPKV